MRLLFDNDAFCKLGVCGLIHHTVRVLGADIQTSGRLASLPYMLRRGRLRRRYGATESDVLIPVAEALGVAPEPTARWLDRIAIQPEIDPGEAQLFAAAADAGLTVVTGDKRALRALNRLPDLAAELAGRIVCFEAALLALCDDLGCEELRGRVQPLLTTDTSVRICFSPVNPELREALESYYQALAHDVRPLVLWYPTDTAAL